MLTSVKKKDNWEILCHQAFNLNKTNYLINSRKLQRLNYETFKIQFQQLQATNIIPLCIWCGGKIIHFSRRMKLRTSFLPSFKCKFHIHQHNTKSYRNILRARTWKLCRSPNRYGNKKKQFGVTFIEGTQFLCCRYFLS